MRVGQLLEIVRTRLGIASEAWHIGADRLAGDDFARPRYVWVPTRDPITRPERAGGNPRQLFTRDAGLELHLWTETLDDAEARIEAVMVAWYLEAHGSLTLESINWHPGESSIDRGFLTTLSMRVRIPVTETKPTAKATALAIDTTGIVHGDGNLDSGETS